MKNYLYILYFSNGKYLKIGVSSKSIHRVKQLSKIYDIDFEKSLIFETSRKISLSLERSLLSVSTPLNENPFVNLDGCTEIRDIEYLEYFMDILKLHIVQHNIKVNKIRTFITIHNNELIDNEKVKKLINWVELSRHLAGNETSISSNRVPLKYKNYVNELVSVFNDWIAKYP